MHCEAQIFYNGVALVLLEVLAVSKSRIENYTAFTYRERS